MNLKEFLTDYGVRFWTSGNNVQKGNINITCVFCNDQSNHLGINKKNLKVRCWKCGRHYIGTLVSQIVGCSLKEAKEIIKTIDGGGDNLEKEDASPIDRPNRVILPPEASKDFPALHINYLRKRGFNPRKIIKKYDLYSCYTYGKFKFRIIIPIYKNGRMVAYTSRDVTNDSKLRYKNAKDKDCVVNPQELIYNIDSIKPYQDAINVEGCPDCWKMGDGSFSFLGISITEKRIIEVAAKKIQTLFIIYDNEKNAQAKAKKHARILAPLVKQIEIIKLSMHKDPGELKYTQVEEIKRAIGFRYEK